LAHAAVSAGIAVTTAAVYAAECSPALPTYGAPPLLTSSTIF